MSSDEEASVPVLPTESTYRSNSASPELHDEYEALLQSSVASPRFEATFNARLVGRGASHLSTEDHNSQINSQGADQTGNTTSRGLGGSDRLQDASESTQPNTQGFTDYTEVELFISDENINKMEYILDTWTQKLKTNVLMELRKWRVAFIDQHRRELQKEREMHSGQNEALKTEVDTLKELLNTFETSNKRKDEMIRNLSVVLNRQKQKLEKMRAFTHWRNQYSESKEEAHSLQIARQHYNLHLKRKVWLEWHGLVKKGWKVRMEAACRTRAEEVCTRLSENYDAQIQTMASEHTEALEKAQAEIERVQLDQERREVCMRKALMRGVCALNIETLHLFTTTEGGPQDSDEYDPNSPPDDDDSDPAASSQVQPRPARSPTHHEDSNRMGAHTAAGHASARHAAGRHTPATHSLFSHGAGPGFHKQASQQKSAKGLTGRSSTQHVGKNIRSNLETMSVAPPMSSSAVDYHHPITKQTLGQATASKFPRSSQQAPCTTGGWASSSTYSQPPCPVGSPVHFDHPVSPAPHEDDSRMGVWYTNEVLPSTSAAHSSFPQGGSTSFHKQASGRMVTAGQQKPAKTITARITAQPFAGKSGRSNLQVMGMTPPMTSIVVERHQPITRGPRTPTVVKTSSRTNTNTCNVHSIKVVE